MLNVNTNYNTSYNMNFKANAQKIPAYKKLQSRYDEFERRSNYRVRDFLRDKLDEWSDGGGVYTFGALFIGAILAFIIGFARSMHDKPKRVQVKNTTEYVRQYEKTNELYEEGALINGEYKTRLNKLLPEYDSLINQTSKKLDNVVQLRILRSDANFPKDKAGNYRYTIEIKGKKAYVVVAD